MPAFSKMTAGKHIEHFTDDFAVDPKNPRVEVIIEEFEGGYKK